MKTERLAAWLLPRMKQYAEDHKPTQMISNGSGSTNPPIYLVRWKLIDATPFHPGLYLHNMKLDDDISKHTHPYPSLSLNLSDGLIEEYQDDPPSGPIKVRRHKAGEWVYRSSTFAHQLRVEPGSDPWTLFIPGRRLAKGWGFWCPKGFQPHPIYHRLRREGIAAGKTGPRLGCGED